MSMMSEFFDITKDSKEIFKGTKIMDTPYASELNQYPTIFISFADAKENKETIVKYIKTQLQNEYIRYHFIFNQLNELEQNDYLYILEGLKNKNNGILNDVDNAIVFLMRCLKKYYGKDVMLFIDEYDTPFIEAKTGNFYQELKGSLATLLRSSLKNSEDLKYAFITGIQRVAKENIFSDLNNLDVYTVCDREYSEYFGFDSDETKKLLTEKLNKVDPDKIVEPEPYVAIPAIQAISYAMNSDELRNLYANLLAKSMISDTKDTVHPSFVEIIKQMSPIDAHIFQIIMSSQLRPIIDLKKELPGSGSLLIQSHCSWISDFSIKQCAASIDNLLRLGLIEIPYGEYYSNTQAYDYVKQNPLFQKLEQQSSISLNSGESLEYDNLYIKLSDLSTLFYNICVLNP